MLYDSIGNCVLPLALQAYIERLSSLLFLYQFHKLNSSTNFTTDTSSHLVIPETNSHRRSTSRDSLARHLIRQAQLSKRMSQYGSQQYGQGQQDPSAGGYAKQEQDPSAGGYAGQEDPNQEDPAAGGYAQQDHSQLGGDPSADGQQNFNSQENGYGQGHAQQDSSQQGQMSNGFNAVAKHRQDANGTMTQARPGVSPKHAHYTPEHHNALHHAGQVASKYHPIHLRGIMD